MHYFSMQAGFYIAWHPWLGSISGGAPLFKVGHSEDLRRRLRDSCYTTTWPPGWHYLATLETTDKILAEKLEQAVLKALEAHRVDDRELIQDIEAESVINLGLRIADALEIAVTRRQTPIYSAPPVTAAKKREILSKNEILAVCKLEVHEFTLEDIYPVPVVTTIIVTDEFTLDDIYAVEINYQMEKGSCSFTLDDVYCDNDSTVSQNNITYEVCDPEMLQLGAATLDEPDDFDTAEFTDNSINADTNITDREYQTIAARNCVDELRTKYKCILQMACRSGKTKVAYNVMREYFASGAKCIAYLVPSLTLLRQTVLKLQKYALHDGAQEFDPGNMLLVGSDHTQICVTNAYPKYLTMTTNQQAVQNFINSNTQDPKIIICMYQSSHLLVESCKQNLINLIICDEAHRVCGGDKKLRAMNLIPTTAKSLPNSGHKLFMTATPEYDTKKGLNMKDEKIFGKVASRYYLRQGIDAGFINNFRLEILVSTQKESGNDPIIDQITEAMCMLSERGPTAKLLVFCRTIKHSKELCEKFEDSQRDNGEPIVSLVAHSQMRKSKQIEILREFINSPRAVLFNCRLFQEGVEIPDLNGVLFASPRHSHTDIIQSLCRPLNKYNSDGTPKPESIIFLPLLVDTVASVAGAPKSADSVRRFENTIVNVFEALSDEDPALFEHLIDPTNRNYAIGCRGAGRRISESITGKILSAARYAALHTQTGVLRPLARTKNVPWNIGFAALERIVREHNRYPIVNEVVKLDPSDPNGISYKMKDMWQKHYAAEYRNWRDGKPTTLLPYQAHQLETLPGWNDFGFEGTPYPPRRCLSYLEQWLADNNGVPPMVNVDSKECVALDATEIERLSGYARVLNNQDGNAKGKDGKIGPRVSEWQQQELDRICEQFGLTWRKTRLDNGAVDTTYRTFIQESHQKLKDYYKDWQAGRNDGAYIRQWFVHNQFTTPGMSKDKKTRKVSKYACQK